MTEACENIRMALSARLDGFDSAEDTGRLDEHLAGCAACRTWLASAQQLTLPVLAAPDLTAPILAAVAADRATAQRSRSRILQLALALSAVVQLALALPALLLQSSDALVHVSREAASFDIALAVGFA